jgi:hypothetical protein
MAFYLVFGHDAANGQTVAPFRVDADSEAEAKTQAQAMGLVVDLVEALPVLKLIGYWARDGWDLPYPHPRQLVRQEWRSEDRSRIVAYLRTGQFLNSQIGHSYCRFACGVPDRAMGSSELTDGEWAWPEGLAHYIESHSVCLPDEFVATMETRNWQVPTNRRVLDPDLVDESFWVSWSCQFKDKSA